MMFQISSISTDFQQIVQANNEENVKAQYPWPIVWEIHQ